MSDDIGDKSYYEKDGVQYPRVTNILKTLDKSGLARWRGRLGNAEADRVSQEGSRIGREFHQLAHEINMGAHMVRGWQAPGEYRHMAAAYIDWLHKYVARIERMEATYYSEDPRYGGTLDLLAYFRGDRYPSIIDLKTSNVVSEDWPLQLSAYRTMVRASGIEVARRVIVRIPKSGTVEAETYDYTSISTSADDEDEAAWYETLRLWQWQQGSKQRAKAARVVTGLQPIAA